METIKTDGDNVVIMSEITKPKSEYLLMLNSQKTFIQQIIDEKSRELEEINKKIERLTDE